MELLYGDKLGRGAYVRGKIQKWIMDVQCLSKIAATQPQASYAALTEFLQYEWKYF